MVGRAKNSVYEITAAGFNSDTDDTDERIFWVMAASETDVLRALSDTGATLHGKIDVVDNIDFCLPGDEGRLRERLMTFLAQEPVQPIPRRMRCG